MKPEIRGNVEEWIDTVIFFSSVSTLCGSYGAHYRGRTRLEDILYLLLSSPHWTVSRSSVTKTERPIFRCVLNRLSGPILEWWWSFLVLRWIGCWSICSIALTTTYPGNWWYSPHLTAHFQDGIKPLVMVRIDSLSNLFEVRCQGVHHRHCLDNIFGFLLKASSKAPDIFYTHHKSADEFFGSDS